MIIGDRIAEIGPVHKLRIPQNATVFDSEGAYLMPGLADMHVHLRGDWPISQLGLYTEVEIIKHIYGTDRIRNMLSHTVTAGILKPGQTYRYKVHVMDSEDGLRCRIAPRVRG